MKKILILFAALFAIAIIAISNYKSMNSVVQESLIPKKILAKFEGAGGVGENAGRFEWQFNRLKDPATGQLPRGFRQRELDFDRKMTAQTAYKTAEIDTLEWVNRGPYNIGGRTRAFAIDVNDENTIIAIGVSGSIWKTINAGESWSNISDKNGLQGATALVQDTRPGKTDNWYYITGEAYGNSAGGAGAFYLGSGVFKSTDNGETWNSLENTSGANIYNFDNYFDACWSIALDSSNMEQDVVYVSTLGNLFKSVDGGENWEVEIFDPVSDSYFTTVEVSKTGTVYCAFSSDSDAGGLWRKAASEDLYTNVIPEDFPSEFDRMVMGINPSNENEIYCLFRTIEGSGKTTYNWQGDPEWNALWKYTYLSGDGFGEGGEWINLSENLPIGPNALDDFNAQGGYNLLVEVSPSDPNTVFIGGTNLFRSTDGFKTSDNITFIGGYDPESELSVNLKLYKNHHPDQHGLWFSKSNPDDAYSFNDGGIYQTNDINAETVEWTSLNNGYISAQFYTLTINQKDSTNHLLGGLQDNGNLFVNSDDPTKSWVEPLPGDGSYAALPDHGEFVILSIQQGKVFKIKTDTNGLRTDAKRIDPIGPIKDEYIFINPLAIDPNDQDVLYLPYKNVLWVNEDLSSIPWDGGLDTISTNWRMLDLGLNESRRITAIAPCTNPAGRIYIGTAEKNIYRVDNVLGDSLELTNISSNFFPNKGYVNELVLDPLDNDKMIAIYSNYGVHSIFYTENAGENWKRASGNLEEGSNNLLGPSVRTGSILHTGETTTYFVGTSTGLYSTNDILADDVEWTKVAADQIGTSIVEKVVTRGHDQMIGIATHGNGVFTANAPPDPIVEPMDTMPDDTVPITSINELAKIDEEISFYPNPTTDYLNIKLNYPNINLSQNTQIKIYDQSGRLIKQKNYNANEKIDVSHFTKGVYFLHLIDGDFSVVRKFYFD